MYHRILSDTSPCLQLIEPSMFVTRGVFESHIRYLRRHYTILSLSELLQCGARMRLSPRKKYCVITFDDGWADNYTMAFPILVRYNVPATIFLPTAFIGTTRWFWTEQVAYLLSALQLQLPDQRQRFETLSRLKGFGSIGPMMLLSKANGRHTRRIQRLELILTALKQCSPHDIEDFIRLVSGILNISFPAERHFLTWDEVNRMSAQGITFGSHSWSHTILTRVPDGEIERELHRSWNILQDRTAAHVPAFCYPGGEFDDRIKALVLRSGYQAAFGWTGGLESLPLRDPFAIRRIGVHQEISRSPALFSFLLLGITERRIDR